MRSYSVSKSPSATSTGATTSKDSQLGTKDEQRPQSAFVGLSTTIHTPESAVIPATYRQQDELGLLSETGTTQIGSFEGLAQAATFDDCDQGQSVNCLSLPSEPSRSQRSSQPVDDVVPIVREEPSPDPTDKWIIMSGGKKRIFKCGYEGCGRTYGKKASLQTHFVTHTGDSKLRCHLGDCAGIVIYPNTQALTRHIHAKHTFEKPFGCKICNRRFRRPDHLKHHVEHVLHSPAPEAEKKLLKPQSISESPSITATTASTASTSTVTSGASQSGSAAGQHQQGSFVDLSKTVRTPESTQIPEADQHYSGLRLLVDASISQINPFEALATHQTVTFDDETVTTGIAGVPNLPSDQYQAEQSPDPIDTKKWIIVDKSQEKPYRCGYPECDKTYSKRHHLRRHFVEHTGTSKFKCPHPECVNNEYFGDGGMLKRHIASKHSLEKPFQCDRCNKRYRRKDSLMRHSREHVHSPKKRAKTTNTKEKITRN